MKCTMCHTYRKNQRCDAEAHHVASFIFTDGRVGVIRICDNGMRYLMRRNVSEIPNHHWTFSRIAA